MTIQPVMLSDNFSLDEATASQTAARNGIDNSNPPKEVLERAIKTAIKLEKVRALLGKPIHVNSWIRCQQLNRLLGSSDSSQHPLGEAVDFISPQFGSPLSICKKIILNKTLINFDQLILEHTWIHISWKSIPGSVQRGHVLSLLANGTYSQGLTDTNGKSL
jgi:Peptidase M15